MADTTSLDDWMLLAQFSQVFRTVSDTFTDQVDIPRGQAMVLCTVAKQDGLTQSEIADRLSVQGATITNMLQRLEETGLVVRRRDAEDNRLVRVFLTEIGRQKEEAINERFMAMQQLVFKDISDDERDLLRKQLEQILQNISASE